MVCIPAEPLEMRASAQVVEAMGRVFGLACTALYTCGRSPERIAALERFVSRASRLSVLVLYDAAVSEEVLLRYVPHRANARNPPRPKIHGDVR